METYEEQESGLYNAGNWSGKICAPIIVTINYI